MVRPTDTDIELLDFSYARCGDPEIERGKFLFLSSERFLSASFLFLFVKFLSGVEQNVEYVYTNAKKKNLQKIQVWKLICASCV